jgi:cytidine deaminase
MRDITDNYRDATSLRGLSRIAEEYSLEGLDSYSDYGVGAALLVDFAPQWSSKPQVYAGFNVNLSGMEVKIHAEQVALFQFLLDLETISPTEQFPHIYEEEGDMGNAPEDLKDNARIKSMVVVTSEHDGAVKCGHCLQVTEAVCEYIYCDPSEVDYIAAWRTDGDVKPFKYNSNTLQELLGHTYITS